MKESKIKNNSKSGLIVESVVEVASDKQNQASKKKKKTTVKKVKNGSKKTSKKKAAVKQVNNTSKNKTKTEATNLQPYRIRLKIIWPYFKFAIKVISLLIIIASFWIRFKFRRY